MKSKIIKAFFDGTFSDQVIKSPRTDEYKDIDKRETELNDKLRPQLTGEQLKLFDEFVDLYGERHSLEEENYFIRGFKFGVRLLMECLDLSDVVKEA
mgnify:CR=1 FL=1